MRDACEGPQFQAEVEPFWMATMEVTWDAYDLWGTGKDIRLREATGSAPGPNDGIADAITQPTTPYFDKTRGMGREGFPAISMTQLAAKVYCKWLSAKTGRYYRLPTEAEWEYACRAGTTTAYSFGDDPADLDAYGWYYGNSDDAYHLVGTKQPNPWGLYDTHGNVEEWCLDWYGPYPVGDRVNPVGPAEGEFRVTRGGSHSTEAYYLRSANRQGALPGERSWYIGFRVVMGELPELDAAPAQPLPLHQRDVSAAPRPAEPTPAEPFAPPCRSHPREHVMVQHNHVPAVVCARTAICSPHGIVRRGRRREWKVRLRLGSEAGAGGAHGRAGPTEEQRPEAR